MILPAGPAPASPERLVIFIRHGQVAGAAGRCIGQTEVDLTAEGHAAVRALAVASAERWTATGPGKPRLVASDLRRARDSAAIIGSVLGVRSEADRRLREMHFGAWDGHTWSEIEETDGARLRSWTESWWTTPAPGGEGVPDLARRADAWIATEARPGPHDARTLIVVSHSGFIRTALCQLLGYSLTRMFDLPVGYARATTVQVAAGSATLIEADTALPMQVR